MVGFGRDGGPRDGVDTTSDEYTQYLQDAQRHWLKRLIEPVNPYRWNIKRLCVGRTLDVGCGIGRNLRYLGRPDSVGVDHNLASIEIARVEGFHAFTPESFHAEYGDEVGKFDTILIAHVLEHLRPTDCGALMEEYLPYLRKGGRVVLICPQERGFRSDSTHLTYFDTSSLAELAESGGLRVSRLKSFPLPKKLGRVYIYNEHIVVAVK